MLKKFLIIFFYSHLVCAQTNGAFLSQSYIIEKGDTLYDLADNMDLGLNEILQANPQITDPHRIYEGAEIILPTTHLIPTDDKKGIVINLAEPRLYFFPKNGGMKTFPVTIGDEGKTPLGKTKIKAKKEKPVWIPPASIREENPNLPEVVLSGPDNPLGNYALYLDDAHHAKWHNIIIHGTNVPTSIGSKVSHGCIRLYADDIELLFSEVEVGEVVKIIDQAIKVAEINGRVYLEVHLKNAVEMVPEELGVQKTICQKVEDCEMRINWQKVDEVVINNLGLPTDITN